MIKITRSRKEMKKCEAPFRSFTIRGEKTEILKSTKRIAIINQVKSNFAMKK
jgi:hypothetical protein